MLVQPLEERRLLAVTAVADIGYSTSSAAPLMADDALGVGGDVGSYGVLVNDSGATAVASTGTFLTTEGATVTINADGTFVYDPNTSTSIQALAPAAALNDTFAYTATDGMGNFSTAQVTIEVAGNHAPVVVDPNPQLFVEVARNERDDVGMSVGNLQFNLLDADLTSAPPTDIGIAIVDTDAGDGRWQYSIDFGVTWIDVGGVSDSNALLLDGDARVRYVPGSSSDQVSFTYRAWDLSQGTSGDRANASSNGGNTQFSSQVGTATGIVWTLDVPSDPIIDSNGRTQLTFVLAAPVNDAIYEVTIDWGDGTIQPLGFIQNGTYTISHTYKGNPAGIGLKSGTSIPILIEAIAFVTSDEGATTRVLTIASPALTGQTPDPAPTLPGPATLVTNPPPQTGDIVLPTPTPVVQTESVDIRGGSSYLSANPLKQYVLRVVTPVDAQGNVEESPDKPLRDDALEDLPGLYQQLDNDRYRIYELRRDGSYRLVQDVMVRDGVATPVDDEQLPAPDALKLDSPEVVPPSPVNGDAALLSPEVQLRSVNSLGSAGVALFGLSLVVGAESQRAWKKRVDEAFESAEAARRLQRLRRRKKRDNSSH